MTLPVYSLWQGFEVLSYAYCCHTQAPFLAQVSEIHFLKTSIQKSIAAHSEALPARVFSTVSGDGLQVLQVTFSDIATCCRGVHTSQAAHIEWNIIEYIFFFITYTITQSITSSEICSLQLTHPSAPTLGAVGSRHLWRPGSIWGVRCLAQGSHLSRGQFLPEPRFKPTTSSYKTIH